MFGAAEHDSQYNIEKDIVLRNLVRAGACVCVNKIIINVYVNYKMTQIKRHINVIITNRHALYHSIYSIGMYVQVAIDEIREIRVEIYIVILTDGGRYL